MNDRARAIEILQQARDLLAERLTERIVEFEQDLLDDAAGRRYLSDIETLYEELGSRLAHVSAMLAHLPPPAEPEFESAPSADSDLELEHWFAHDLSERPLRRGFLALPPPSAAPAGAAARGLHGFLRQVHDGNLPGGAALLTLLFDLESGRAQRATDVFAVQAALRPELYTRVIRLRLAVELEPSDEAQAILSDCFGLAGAEARSAVRALRGRLTTTPDAQVR